VVPGGAVYQHVVKGSTGQTARCRRGNGVPAGRVALASIVGAGTITGWGYGMVEGVNGTRTGPSNSLIGIEFESLSHGANQMTLFDPESREKLERLARAADQLRDRFGFAKVQFGGSLGSSDDH